MAEAIHRLDYHAAGVGIGDEAVAMFEVGDEILAAGRLTGFGATDLQHRPVYRSTAEILIETDDADGVRPGDVERRGDQRDRRCVDIAEALHEIVQDRQHGALLALSSFDERIGFRLAPIGMHHRIASRPTHIAGHRRLSRSAYAKLEPRSGN